MTSGGVSGAPWEAVSTFTRENAEQRELHGRILDPVSLAVTQRGKCAGQGKKEHGRDGMQAEVAQQPHAMRMRSRQERYKRMEFPHHAGDW